MRTSAIGLAVWLGVAAPGLAQAQERTPRTEQTQSVGVVRVGGTTVLSLAPAGQYSGQQRASMARSAILDALKPEAGSAVVKPFKLPDDVQAGFRNGLHVVLFRGKIVATVTTQDVKFQGVSAPALAKQWAQELRDALAGLNIDERTAFTAIVNDFQVAELQRGEPGTTTASREDQQLASRIRSRLESSRQLRDQDLTVDVRNGVVTLRGSVQKPEMEERAIDLVRDTEGVKEVRSDVRIEQP